MPDTNHAPSDFAPSAGSLADRIVAFGRVLRRAGLTIGSDQMMDALRAVETVGVARRADMRQALYAVFVRRRADAELFDQAFRLFWRAPSDLNDLLSAMLPDAGASAEQDEPQQRVQEALQEKNEPPPQPEDEREYEEVELIAAYSAAERLKEKDFADFTTDEVAEAKAFMERLVWPIEKQKVRRRSPRAKGRPLDLRRTMRTALRHHGELLRLRRQGPKRKPRPVVVLCDISGSMEPYARMLLHFMHALTGGMRRVEGFVFGTRLTRITRHLRQRDVDAAVTAATAEAEDWDGGTRIGEAVRAFNYEWLRRTLRSTGVVLIISDGCDRGDADLLGQEMARLARSAHRVLWLNPLLRYDGYEPLTRGMQAALPHIDDLLSVHNLASLEQLAEALGDAVRRG